jgi:ribonuclease T2
MIYTKGMKVQKINIMLFLVTLAFGPQAVANSCVDRSDSYEDYDNKIISKEINNLPSQYYILSYSWSPNHCKKVSSKSKKAGGKNYLQCVKNNKFGYILHGLWPQGAIQSKRNYPRACKGDKPKIPRAKLAPFLCMTPSVWLLQHEYEYHGTCMPNKELRTPTGYLEQAKKLHDVLELPKVELKSSEASFRWWYKNNPHLKAGAVQYWRGANEWQMCYDTNFTAMVCPSNQSKKSLVSYNQLDKSTIKSKLSADNHREVVKPTANQCVVKGNISKKSRKKLYFLSSHPQYRSVKIDEKKGERCFLFVEEAQKAGWVKAK